MANSHDLCAMHLHLPEARHRGKIQAVAAACWGTKLNQPPQAHAQNDHTQEYRQLGLGERPFSISVFLAVAHRIITAVNINPADNCFAIVLK